VSPSPWVAFVTADAIGAPVRYLVDGAVSNRTEGAFRVGHLRDHGSLLLGFLAGSPSTTHSRRHQRLPSALGFCGGYITLSAFTFETVRLVEEGAINEAIPLGTLLTCAAL
jgi:fluoride exporter